MKRAAKISKPLPIDERSRIPMKVFDNCEKAVEFCISNNYFSVARLFSSEKPEGIHMHDCYELYYSVSGGKQFLIDNQLYSIEAGDAFFINQFESHCLTSVDRATHERVLVLISPNYLKSISTEATDLDQCFREHAKESSHRIHLLPEEQKRFLFYIDTLKESSNFGADIMERSAFGLLMVYMTKRYLNHQYAKDQGADEISGQADGRSLQVNGIISYINQHLGESISLEQIAGQFHLSSSYMCRIFKAATGTTINQYIKSKRLVQAKRLLIDGCSAVDAAELCGFGDYSNFYRAFTRATNLSPQKYAQFATSREVTEGSGVCSEKSNKMSI